MASLNVKARLAALFFYAKKPGVLVVGLPSSTVAKSSSDNATLSETGAVEVVKSSSDSATLSQTELVTAHVDSTVSETDTFTFEDDPNAGTSITFVAAGTNAGTSAPTWTVNLPAGINADDLIIAQLFLSGGGVTSDFYPVSGPAGWTIEDEAGAAGRNGRVLFAWKRAVGTESSTSVTFSPTSGGGSVDCRSRSAVYRGANWDGGPFDGGSAWGEEISYASDNPQPGPVITTLSNELQIVLSFTFGGFVGSGDHFIPSSGAAVERYADYFTSGFTGTNLNLCDVPMGSPAGHSVSGTWRTLAAGKAMGWVTRVIKTSSPGASISIGVITAAGETITSSSTDSVSTASITAKSSSDSGMLDDEAGRAVSDAEVAFLSENEAVASSTPAAKSSSDSATLTDAGSVTVPIILASSDSATLSDSQSVVQLADANYFSIDTLAFSERWAVLVGVSSSDSATVASDDGGPPGGGGAGDGGGTGAGGGPGVVVTFGRIHAHTRIG